jgi:hypothetical protein
VCDLARAFGAAGASLMFGLEPLLGGLVDETSLSRAAALFEDPALADQLRSQLVGGEG